MQAYVTSRIIRTAALSCALEAQRMFLLDREALLYEQLDSPLVADNHNMGERSDLVQGILGLLIHRTISLGR